MKTFLAFSLTVVIMGAYPTFAHDGDLDLTFGRAGIVTTDFSGNFDSVAALAIQPDGKIVAAGWSINGAKSDAVLSRYNEDGELDVGFGTDGRVYVIFPDQVPFFANYPIFVALGIQPDGKIVGLGKRAGNAFLVRFENNGMLDTSFGNGGFVTALRYPFALAIQPDGKMVVALGDQWIIQQREGRFAGLPLGSLVRYNSDGTLDTTFGDQGTVDFLNGSGQGVWSRVVAVAVQSDGKIVAGGSIIYNVPAGGSGTSDFAVARYNSDGQPDTSFGTDGIVETNTLAGEYQYAYDSVTALAVQSDGKIVAGGGARYDFGLITSTAAPLVLVRYNSNGTLDTAFGDGGIVSTAGAGMDALAIQADGKIVAAGGFPFGLQFGLARYASDGSLDVTFGAGGIVVADFTTIPPYFLDCLGASAVAIQADGKIVAAGMSNFGWICAPDFALARYNNNRSVTNISRINLTFTPERVNAGDSFFASFLGIGITSETFFDLRFRNPIGGNEQVALNWQQGTSALHTTTIGTTPGTWTITGVRPHQIINDHTGEFVPISATFNVVH